MNIKTYHLVVLFTMAILCSCEKEENFELVSSSIGENTNIITSKAQSPHYTLEYPPYTLQSGATLTFIEHHGDYNYLEFYVENLQVDPIYRTVTIPVDLTNISVTRLFKDGSSQTKHFEVSNSELIKKDDKFIFRTPITREMMREINRYRIVNYRRNLKVSMKEAIINTQDDNIFAGHRPFTVADALDIGNEQNPFYRLD